jgi:hypothetical protein
VSAALAVSSRPGWQTEESICGTPNCAAARAAVAAPPSTIDSSPPMGASMTGSLTLLFRKVLVASTLLTSRSTRGRKASVSIACRLRRTVVSVSAPPIR